MPKGWLGSAAHRAAQPTELSDEPLPGTKGGNATSKHEGTLQQERRRQGHVPAPRAAGTGTPLTPRRQQTAFHAGASYSG